MAVDTPLTGADAGPLTPKPRRSKGNRGHPPVHGVKMLRRVLRSVPIDLLDKRSAIGVAARKRREELIDHCGGAEAVSPAQVILIDTAVKTELIVRAAEDYILRQETTAGSPSSCNASSSRTASAGCWRRSAWTGRRAR